MCHPDRISSDAFQFLPHLQVLGQRADRASVVDHHSDLALQLEHVVSLELTRTQTHQLVVMQQRSQGLYSRLGLSGQTILHTAGLNAQVMVGFPQERGQKGLDFCVAAAGKYLVDGKTVEVLVNLFDEFWLDFLEVIRELFLVARAVLLHGEVGAVVFFCFFEGLPLGQFEVIVLVV